MTGSIHRNLERALYRRGFSHPQVRQLMLVQIYLGLASTVLCFAVGGLTAWPLAFAAGALLATWNFYHLARFATTLLGAAYSRGMLVSLLARFYGRLLLTGAALFALLFWGELSISAMLAGLSSLVLSIFCWGVANLAGYTTKEA